jgi:fatty acid amide hydrolase
MEEFWSLDGVELAGRFAGGSASALDIVDAHIARIEEVDTKLHAVVVKRYDQARDEARALDARRARGEAYGPLAGVPVTIKESLDVAGTPSTFGLPLRAGDVAKIDDPYVARIRAAGAIVLGKTNVPQLLLFTETDNPLYGRTNNPWNLERSPGGSSGGQAAIVAAGGSPWGLGTDIGGSIRVPATSCGIAGFKPTAGRMPDVGRLHTFAGQTAIVSQVGILARTVRDTRLALELAYGNPPDRVPLGDPAAVDVAALRVGIYENAGALAASPAVARAVREAGAMLAERGAVVVPFEPPHAERAHDLLYGILSADGGHGAIEALGSNPRDPRIAQLIMLISMPRPALIALERAFELTGEFGAASIVRAVGRRETHHYWKLIAAQEAFRTLFAHALDTVEGGPLDIVLGPAYALPALVHGATTDLGTGGVYAILYNVLGYPAGIVPITRVREGEETERADSRDRVERAAKETEIGSAGLPVGVQVIARPWRDRFALTAMRALEESARARPDFPRTPVTPEGVA